MHIYTPWQTLVIRQTVCRVRVCFRALCVWPHEKRGWAVGDFGGGLQAVVLVFSVTFSHWLFPSLLIGWARCPSTAGLIGNNWKKKLVLRRKTFYMGTSPKGAVSDSNPVKPFCQIQQIFTHGVLTVRCTFTALILLMRNQKSGSDQAKQQCFSCRSK